MHDFKTEQSILQIAQIDKSRVRQDKTRQGEVTDAGTTVPLRPHLQCRYSDDNIHFIQLKTLIEFYNTLTLLSTTVEGLV